MPQIDCRKFLVNDGAASTIERMLAKKDGYSCDDPLGILICSVNEGVELLRWDTPRVPGFIGRFRTSDFPAVVLAWYQAADTAALVYQLRRGQVEVVHLLLGGVNVEDDAAGLAATRHALGDRFPGEMICSDRPTGRVLHVQLNLGRSEVVEDGSDLLPLIALVPIFCELSGIDDA